MKPFPESPQHFLFIYAYRNLKLFLLIMFCIIASSFCSKVVPYLFTRMVKLFDEGVKFEEIQSSIWLLLACIVFATILKEVFFLGMQFFTDTRFRPIVYKQMSHDTYVYLNGHSTEYFSDNLAGALGQKAHDLSMNGSSFFLAVIYYVLFVMHCVATFFFMGCADLSLTFYFFIVAAFSFYYWVKRGMKLVPLRKDMIEAHNYVSGAAIDLLQNHLFVRIFNAFKHENQKTKEQFQNESNVFLRYLNYKTVVSFGQRIYFQIIHILFVAYALYLWAKQGLSTADFVLIFMLLGSIFNNIHFLIQRTYIYFSELMEIKTNLEPFTKPHDIQDIKNAPSLKVSEGNIELKNVTFAYKKHSPLFNNINLKIKAKEKVGIVGMSGGGKSTLISLLLRLYDIQSGEILIDNQNIAKVTQESLHKSISFVPQTSVTIERSIRDNIAYGKPSASLGDVMKAAKEAYADEFIEELPNKYKTILNADNKLSGGQMQRIAIARALLKNSKILILDEATSSLDSKSEFYIQKAIDNMIVDKTVIAIAHRLSTLKNMDRIIVMEKGKIVEGGSLDSLLQNHGKFYHYWEEQKLKELNNDK